MSIRYATGTYQTPSALLTAIDTHIVDVLGWTRNMGPTLVAGKSGRRAHYQKTITKDGVARTVYWNLLAPGATEVQGTLSSETNKLGFFSYPSTGYDAGLAWDRQPGYPVASTGGLGLFPASTIELAPASPLNFIIAGNAYGDVYVVFAITNGSNRSISAGVLNKSSCGPYDGGEFAGAACFAMSANWASNNLMETPFGFYTVSGNYGAGFLVRATVDGVTNWVTIQNEFNSTDTAATTPIRGTGNVGCVKSYASAENWPSPALLSVSYVHPSISVINGIIMHRDIQCAVMRTTSRFSMLGNVPLIAWSSIVVNNGIPWGTIVGNKFYTNYIALELRDE
ncbi:MAG: hypothetical protein WC455_31025 [Dehalococcoidia bacterium]|jgi:hypothetical protein